MLAHICRGLLRLWGFSVKGDLSFNEKGKKSILAVVPHTHWMDFPLGLLVRTGYKLQAKFLAKSALFTPLYGWFFKMLGGYPVVSSKRTNFVDSVVEIYNQHETFCIAIAPEGTRKKVTRLKSGFYWIAKRSDIDIIMTVFDIKNKQIIFFPPFRPTENAKEDLKILSNMVSGYEGFMPEKSFTIT